jgi:hypothetical protein
MVCVFLIQPTICSLTPIGEYKTPTIAACMASPRAIAPMEPAYYLEAQEQAVGCGGRMALVGISY